MVTIFILGSVLFIIGGAVVGWNVNKLWVAIMINMIFGFSVMLLVDSVAFLSEKHGAYKQLHNEYTIRYVVDEQGNVCDSVIVNFE